jgi:hypothetical protein
MRPTKLSAERAGLRMPGDTLCSGQKSHGHDHASYHRNHRSFARWRRFLWAGPLVVSLYGPEQSAVIWSRRGRDEARDRTSAFFTGGTGISPPDIAPWQSSRPRRWPPRPGGRLVRTLMARLRPARRKIHPIAWARWLSGGQPALQFDMASEQNFQ